ncbi:type I-E CRISPR-associated protein Cse1/CasA [Micrococcus luteus]
MQATEYPTYDLLTEPWITVTGLDGTSHQVGIREALTKAEDIATVTDADGGVEAALLRLFGAVLHAAAYRRVRSGDDLNPLNGDYPAAEINAYLDEHANAFDLFHPDRPFLQAPHASQFEARTPMTLGAPWFPGSGSKAYLNATMVPRDTDALDAGLAARLLLSSQAWGSGQKTSGPLPKNLFEALEPGAKPSGSTPAGPLAGALIVVPTGETLAETLLLNLAFPKDGDPGIPVWEVNRGGARPSGHLGRLAWPARAYLLDASDDGRKVTAVHFGAGHRLDTDTNQATETTMAWNPAKGEKAATYMRGRADLVLWRSTPTLYGWGEAAGVPQVRTAASWRESAWEEGLIQVTVYGRDNVGMSPATVQIAHPMPMVWALVGEYPHEADVEKVLAGTTKAAGSLRHALNGITEASTLWSEVEPHWLDLLDALGAASRPVGSGQDLAVETDADAVRAALVRYAQDVTRLCLDIFDREAGAMPAAHYAQAKNGLRGSLRFKAFKEFQPEKESTK